jgi:DNA primase
MPGIDYATVRQSVPMSQVLEFLAFEPVRRSGNQLRGPCPVHRSSSPQSRSFSANLAANAFRCFTSGASGNQLDLWRQVQGLTFLDAAVDLCQRVHLPVPWSRQSKLAESREAAQRREIRDDASTDLKSSHS